MGNNYAKKNRETRFNKFFEGNFDCFIGILVIAFFLTRSGQNYGKVEICWSKVIIE